MAARAGGDERLLVGTETSDDAGVYLLDEKTALVQTVDVITPIVDDPFDFGFIAAVNALSDVYAMGGTPLTAMTFLAFDPCALDLEGARAILDGALAALEEAQCILVGGHTVQDPEIKFGLAVTGTVAPDGILTNAGAGEGDLIYLTKPLGTGIASTALKGEMAPDALIEEATGWMKMLNRDAAAAAREAGASAMTDVTGFGLLGHLAEMCRGSGLGVELELASVPLMEGVEEMAGMGMVPEGAYANRDHLVDFTLYEGKRPDDLLPLFDPQTSGGLVVAVPDDRGKAVEGLWKNRELFFSRIGRFIVKSPSIWIRY